MTKKQTVMEPKMQNLLIGLGVILIVIAGIFYFKSKNTVEPTPSPLAEEVLVQEEGAVKKTGEVVQPLSDEEIVKMREEVDSVLSSAGEAVSFKNVAGTAAWGEAKRAFSDGKFYHRLTVTGLTLPGKGYYYEGWLGKEDSYFSTGRLEVNVNGQGVLYYTTSVDKSSDNQVLLTLEPEDGNPLPATHVLEGQF